MAEWINVKERLPPVGVKVFVHGAFTNEGYPKPKASLNAPEDRPVKGMWSSTEWRGTVGITHWREEKKTEE